MAMNYSLPITHHTKEKALREMDKCDPIEGDLEGGKNES